VIRPGLRAVWVAAALALAGACAAPPAQAPAVVLIVLDTTRADHLSCYGYERETTPQFDRLAAEGQRFEQAFAQAPWTLPAVASILTGQPPYVHGAGIAGDTLLPVRDDVATLAERVSALGFRTAAFVNVIFWGPGSKLDRGFEVYDYRPSNSSNTGSRDAAATTDAALRWLDDVGDAPFLLVVHYFDPHLTYDPPADYVTLFDDQATIIPTGFGSTTELFELRAGLVSLGPAERAALVARYDAELRFVDTQFGRLREGLARAGRWDDSLVLVVGDHGEEFWDHGGFEHGHTHHREVLQVPLIVRRPGGVPQRRAERVTQLDVVPTVLEWIGVALPAELSGTPLGGGHGARYAVAAGSLWSGELLSARGDAGTLIRHRESGRTQYFASDDPLELDDLWDDRPREAEALSRLVDALPSPEQPAAVWRPDAEEIEQLRALGYLR